MIKRNIILYRLSRHRECKIVGNKKKNVLERESYGFLKSNTGLTKVSAERFLPDSKYFVTFIQ